MTEAIVGRTAELAALASFLDGLTKGVASLVLEGEAGIGKTHLWKVGVALARDRSYRVLTCRPIESEAQLSFTGLDDLLGSAFDDALQALPEGLAQALSAALLRPDATGASPEPRAVSLAVLHTLRALAATGPVLLAVDDVQWLDGPSLRALEFAVRRLDTEPVGVLASLRPDLDRTGPPTLDRALPEDRTTRVELSPLSVEATEAMLRDRLTQSFPRATLAQIHRSAGGNPFFALEIARLLQRRAESLGPGQLPPIPDTLRQATSDRVDALPAGAREVLLALACLSRPTVAQIEAVLADRGNQSAGGIAEALAADLIEIDGDLIRSTNALLSSVVYSRTPPEDRRRLHRLLAEVVNDPEERARYLALATVGPNEEVAATLDEAALHARSRGAPEVAAELSELARRLTAPPDEDARRRRGIEAAEYHFKAGDTRQARGLLEEVVAESSAGPGRASALRRLGWIRYHEDSYDAAARLFDEALAEAGNDLALRAGIERDLAWAGLKFGDIQAAAGHARTALKLAESLGEPGGLAEALTALGLSDAVLGRSIRADIMQRAIDLEGEAEERQLSHRPSRSFGLMMKLGDDLEGARSRFETLYRQAIGRGDDGSIPPLLYHMSEIECWAGRWDEAMTHAVEGIALAERVGQEPTRAELLYCQALIDALRGRIDQARAGAEAGRAIAEATSAAVAYAKNSSVLGFLELSLGNPAGAHRYLGPLAETVPAMRLLDPSVLRFLPDEVEALIVLGEVERAGVLVTELERRAKVLGASWAPAAVARCRGLLAAAHGDARGARVIIQKAVHRHEDLGQPFELGRTLLAAGAIQRRDKQKAAARASFERALAIFDELGSALWSDRAKAELGRAAHRTTSHLQLSEMEERVAGLAAVGRTNKEIADSLFVSVRTVETHLTSIFRKLSIRSRTELGGALASRTVAVTDS